MLKNVEKSIEKKEIKRKQKKTIEQKGLTVWDSIHNCTFEAKVMDKKNWRKKERKEKKIIITYSIIFS